MRIAFVVIGNSRRSNYLNGHTLRYGGAGGSGTDSSVILIAEYLSKKGFECVIALDDLEPNLQKEYIKEYSLGEEILGVKYTNKNFDGIKNKSFDILVTMLWFSEYNLLPIKVTKSIIYWSHMQWIYGTPELTKYCIDHKLKAIFVHISNWEKSMTYQSVYDVCKNIDDCKSVIIPNPIMDDVINQVKDLRLSKKKNKFIFHASWPRGGDIALQAVRELNLTDCEFHAFDYLMVTHDHKDSFFYRHNGVDKFTLFKHLAESEYFIYPLYTPYQDVHKDTFSCVVAEAIALGVKVVTYPLGALPENFNNECFWIDFPKGVNPNDLQKEPLSKDLDGLFKTTENIVKKIKDLEKNNSFKDGGTRILNLFNVNSVGNLWLNLLDSI
jgi:glycosyltransferase involved in cell wall biosynthesis